MGDVIVVGGGSAGCVLAARLSEDPGRDVLLLEAGPDYPTIADLPPDVADASQPTTEHDWGFTSEPDADGRSIPLPRARLMGGCGATNGAFAVRGWPADYDRWGEGWSFAEMLPAFRAFEADTDFEDEWHGSDGPVPVSRTPVDDLPPLPRAFLDAARTCGHAFVEDHNRPGSVGAGPTPRNARDGVRMSTALTHLLPARGRPNLDIRAGALVDRVVLDDGRVTGVVLSTGEVVEAGDVVLAAGAYASPAILLRSGIDFPGVGDNLSDHPLVAVDLTTTPGYEGPRLTMMLTMRSSLAGPDDPPDLHIFPAGPWGDGFGIVTGLMAPRSRGSVRLRSADPDDPPRIDIAHLTHPDDMTRMVEATLEARRLSRTPPLSELVTGPELAPGPDIADDDHEALAASIRQRVSSYHHPVGTCAIGTVVDTRGAVFGVEHLWVADASIMPTVPVANPNLTVIAIAERIASWL